MGTLRKEPWLLHGVPQHAPQAVRVCGPTTHEIAERDARLDGCRRTIVAAA